MTPYIAPRGTLALAAATLLILTACGQKQPEAPPAPAAAPEAPAAATPAEPTAAEAASAQAAAELTAREAELARREAELALKEREAAVARAEADLASKQAAAKKAAAAKAAAAAPRPAASTAAPSAPVKPAPPPAPIVVPEGTQMAVELTQELSTKTAKVGQRFDARLASPVTVDGKTALPAGTGVKGSVTEVISGSRKIGGTPTLGLAFDEIQLADGRKLPMSGRLAEAGKSETGKDTAKIAGGAVIGAIIGHQISSKNGKLVGALIGGAAGTIAAQNTGGEVVVPAGTVLGVALTSSVTVNPK